MYIFYLIGAPSVRYSLVVDENQGWFTIDPKSGAITKRQVLDGKTKDLIILTVQTEGTPNTAYAQVI